MGASVLTTCQRHRAGRRSFQHRSPGRPTCQTFKTWWWQSAGWEGESHLQDRVPVCICNRDRLWTQVRISRQTLQRPTHDHTSQRTRRQDSSSDQPGMSRQAGDPNQGQKSEVTAAQEQEAVLPFRVHTLTPKLWCPSANLPDGGQPPGWE